MVHGLMGFISSPPQGGGSFTKAGDYDTLKSHNLGFARTCCVGGST